ncbi:hypothetical protein [Cellulomonas sp. P24]|nr:hypothetical protein [Cellulomonas sp. P24]
MDTPGGTIRRAVITAEFLDAFDDRAPGAGVGPTAWRVPGP